MSQSTLLRHLGLAVLVGAGLYLLAGVLDPFRDYQLATAAGYFCAVAGLTVLTGLNGQISLGHGALMATGAYTFALLQNRLADEGITGQWTLVVGLAAAVVVTTLIGAAIGAAAARLHGPYLAGATMALAVAVPAAATTFDGVFGGDQGLNVALEPPPLSLGATFPVERWQAWIALAAALLVAVFLANLGRGRVGRALRAVRDDEVAAQLAGIHIGRTKVLAFVASAACAGLGGGVFAVLAQAVSPGAYGLTLSLFLVLAVVLGGLGSLAGAAWGSLLLVLLPELTASGVDSLAHQLDLPAATTQRLAGNLPLAIFGLALILLILFAPGGIQGAVRRVLRRPGRASTGAPPAGASPTGASPAGTPAAGTPVAGAPADQDRVPPAAETAGGPRP